MAEHVLCKGDALSSNSIPTKQNQEQQQKSEPNLHKFTSDHLYLVCFKLMYI